MRKFFLLALFLFSNLSFAIDNINKDNVAKAHADLAFAYYSNNQLDFALNSAKTSLAEKENAQAYVALGLIYMSLDNNNDAEIAFQKALKLDSISGYINNNYGLFLCKNGKYIESVNYFGKALLDISYRQNDEQENTLVNAGICIRKAGDLNGAIAFFKKTLTINYGFSVAMLELADTYILLNDLENAKLYLDKYNKLYKGNLKSYYLGAKLAYLSHDIDSYNDYLNQLLSEYPEDKETFKVKVRDFSNN